MSQAANGEHFGLYLVLTRPVAGYERCTEAAVAAGVRYVQLRMKDTPRAVVAAAARRLRAITHGTDTRFMVNDDPDLAAEVGADGVHLGQQDEPLALARRRLPGLRIWGLSTHNEGQALAAMAAAPDYIGVGPVFATPTKERPDPVLGLERMGRIVAATPLTAVAIGGIDAGNLRDVLRAGTVNFAVVRHVCAAANPAAAIRELQAIWQDHHAG
ncbi:MAG: thiamine phosphate synthase [Planctomycetota bacterium]